MEVGERFRAVREALNLSQRALSIELGLSPGLWKHYEAGRSFPGFAVLEALYRRGINIHWLLSGEESLLRTGAKAGMDVPSYVSSAENRISDALGLARLALIGSRGHVREQLSILEFLVRRYPNLATLDEIAAGSHFDIDNIVLELLTLVDQGLVIVHKLNGKEHYSAMMENLLTKARTPGDREQLIFDAITSLAVDIAPAALETPSRGRVLLWKAAVPKGAATHIVNDALQSIVQRSAASKDTEVEIMHVVLGGAVEVDHSG